jgi:hypothetical protein
VDVPRISVRKIDDSIAARKVRIDRNWDEENRARIDEK